ncbi:hypothetical protein GC175_04135 [bacterium]|nr:hypothetical protein [bacterium]
MQRWEYFVMRSSNMDLYKHGIPVDVMNQMGAQGWELVGMLPLKQVKKRFFASNAVEDDDASFGEDLSDLFFTPDYVSTIEFVWKRPIE